MPERTSQDRLERWTAAVLEHAGLTAHDARLTAGAFVLQQMRGVEHHGLARLPPLLDAIREGRVNARPAIRVIVESPSLILLDADHGPGTLACHEAMSRAIDAARTAGTAMAVVRNSSHFLAAAPYCLQAAEAGPHRHRFFQRTPVHGLPRRSPARPEQRAVRIRRPHKPGIPHRVRCGDDGFGRTARWPRPTR
jgi:hypothetical protein